MMAGTPRQIYWVVFIVGALCRVLAVVVWVPSDRASYEQISLPDEQQFWGMARRLSEGEGLLDELGFRVGRMPLYPAYLSLFVDSNHGHQAALIVQALLSALAGVLAAKLALQVKKDIDELPMRSRVDSQSCEKRPLSPVIDAAYTRWMPLLVGLLVAVDPFLVYLSRFALTESFYVVSLVAFVALSWPLARRDALYPGGRILLSGVFFALSVYLRPSSVAFLLLWSVLILWRRRWDGKTALSLMVMLLVLAVALLPWAARNKYETGHWVWLTHRMGISLYDGVGPQASGASNLGDIKESAPVSKRDEAAWNAYFLRRSMDQIREDPLRLAKLAAVKLGRTWRPWPVAEGHSRELFQFIGGMWSLFMLIGAACCLWWLGRRGRWIWMALLLPAVYFTLLHMVFVGSVRYRLPAHPMIHVMVAVGWCGVWLRLRRFHWKEQSRRHL